MSNDINLDPEFFSTTTFIQIGYGLWVSLVHILIGLAICFPTNVMPQLIDDPAFSIVKSEEIWIASAVWLAAPIGCLLGGYIMDMSGRKYAFVLGGIPFFLGWIGTGLSKSATQIIIGRTVVGVGCGMGMGTPCAYITEMSLPNVRGVIVVFTTIALCIGLTIQELIGASFKWNELCYGYAIVSAGIGISGLLLPETPYYVLLQGTIENTKETLKRFRGAHYDISNEINEMIEFTTNNNISRQTFLGQFKLLDTRPACLPFWIIFGYILVSQLSGANIIFLGTFDFLKTTKLPMASRTAYLLLEIVRIVTSILSAVLMYKVDKRPQALISSLGIGVVCLALGLFLLYTYKPTIFPYICYLLNVAFATLGYTLPFLIMYEVYPLQVRGLLGGITNSIVNLMIFGVNMAIPFLCDVMGYAYILIIFGVASCLGTILIFFCLPETSDLTLEEIEEYFNERRPTLVSQRSVIVAQKSQALLHNLGSKAPVSKQSLVEIMSPKTSGKGS